MSEEQAKTETKASSPPGNVTVIKKYANRRLYNTATSTYVTLEDLARMVKEGADFAVYDAKTGDDITRSVLTQIIFEEENKGDNNLLPINFLRQLIQFYGNSMQSIVPGYLEFSLGNLMKEQDKLRQQMMGAFGGDPFKALEEQARRNMELFQQSLKMFPGFGPDAFKAMASGMTGGMAGGMPTGFPNPFAAASNKEEPKREPSKDDIQALKDQLSDMQQKLDALNRR